LFDKLLNLFIRMIREQPLYWQVMVVTKLRSL